MTRAIEILFPVDVTFPPGWQSRLHELLGEVCRDYEAKNRDRIMWPFGQGQKMLMHPGMADDDHPMQYDESTESIEIAERERFDAETYIPGDYAWQSAILNVVGWGGGISQIGLKEWPGQWKIKEREA